jgi:hypothetical protein
MLCVWAVPALAAFSTAAGAASPLSWSAPRLVDHQAPYGDANALLSVACPSTSLCVAGDDNGSC